MTYFISDLHFGHENILELCHRPFSSIKEMDEELIKRWNAKVKKNDLVYIIGDLVWDKRRVADYVERLAGKKILLIGNHDEGWARPRSEVAEGYYQAAKGYFEKIVPYLDDNLSGHPVTLCHYPMLEWRGSRKGGSRKLGYLIHGHIHNNVLPEYRHLYRSHHALNAGADINHFTPATFDELVENNLLFKLSVLQEEDREYLLHPPADDPRRTGL